MVPDLAIKIESLVQNMPCVVKQRVIVNKVLAIFPGHCSR
jgi:hypothetical protein